MATKDLKIYCSSSSKSGDYGNILNDPKGYDSAVYYAWIEGGTSNINYKAATVTHNYPINIPADKINSIVMYAKTFNSWQQNYACESIIDIGAHRTKYPSTSTPQSLQISVPFSLIPNFVSSKSVAFRVGSVQSTGHGNFDIYNNMAIEANKPYIIINYDTIDVSNLLLDSLNIDNPITVSWTAPNQTGFEFQVLQNNILVFATSGTTAQPLLMPAGTIKNDGSTVVRVRSTDATGTYDVTWSDWVETTVTLTKNTPSIAMLAPNNIDKNVNAPIVVSWASSYQYQFRLTIDGKVYNGTTETSLTLPTNTIISGVKTMKLDVTYIPPWATNVADYRTASQTVTFTGTDYSPSISSLEPSSVNQNINLPIVVSWASEYQHQFELTVGGNTYTGATAKSLTLQANALTSGTKTMKLKVIYIPVLATSSADYRIAEKTVTFLAYGKPPIPIQDIYTSYRGALPMLTWTSNEQVAYQVKVMLGETQVSDSGEIISTGLSYTVPEALTNNTVYKSLIRVKNQYGLWSDYSEKVFEISYTEMPQPIISSYGDATNCAIVTNFEIADAVGFATNELWRKEQYGDWIRIAYNMAKIDVYVDYYVKAETEYTYKCRAVDIYGGISESDFVTATAQVTNFRFYNLEDFENYIELIGEPTVTPTRVKNKAVELYAGCSAPSIETDGVIYNTYAMEFSLTKAELDKFNDIADKSKVILFRDRRGNKSFGQVITDISPVKLRAVDSYTISFTFMDVAFLERDVYNGGGKAILLYIDGTWLIDGAQYISGYRS